MPIRSVEASPLPKHDTEKFEYLRSNGACPVGTLDWFRLPQLFRLGQALFGNSMLGYKTRARQNIDGCILHACRVWKAKYPCGATCSTERQATCCALLERAFKEVRDSGVPAYPMMLWSLRQLVNSEWADAALKSTVPATRLDLDSVFREEY